MSLESGHFSAFFYFTLAVDLLFLFTFYVFILDYSDLCI